MHKEGNARKKKTRIKMPNANAILTNRTNAQICHFIELASIFRKHELIERRQTVIKTVIFSNMSWILVSDISIKEALV